SDVCSSDLVALLHRRVRALGAAGADGRPTEKTDTRTRSGAGSRAACGSTKRSAGGRTNQRSNRGAAHGAVCRRAARGCSRLLQCPLLAVDVIVLALFEAL